MKQAAEPVASPQHHVSVPVAEGAALRAVVAARAGGAACACCSAPRTIGTPRRSFDLEKHRSPTRGYFIGDYVGLAADGNDLVTVFPITNDGNLANRTDIVAVRASAARGVHKFSPRG